MSCSLLGNSGHPDPHCTLLHEFMAETCPDSWLNDSTQLEALLKALEPCPAESLDRFFSKRSKSCLKTHFSSGAAPRLERCLNNHDMTSWAQQKTTPDMNTKLIESIRGMKANTSRDILQVLTVLPHTFCPFGH